MTQLNYPPLLEKGCQSLQEGRQAGQPLFLEMDGCMQGNSPPKEREREGMGRLPLHAQAQVQGDRPEPRDPFPATIIIIIIIGVDPLCL